MIQLLGGAAAGGSGARASYDRHVHSALTDRAAAPEAAGRADRAKEELARTANELQRAEAAVDRASSEKEIATSIDVAKRAVREARRAGGDGSTLLAQERRLADLVVKARAKTQNVPKVALLGQLAMNAEEARDGMSPYGLGVYRQRKPRMVLHGPHARRRRDNGLLTDDPGFGHGHRDKSGYDRPPVSDASVEAGAGWLAVRRTLGKENINVGDSKADNKRRPG